MEDNSEKVDKIQVKFEEERKSWSSIIVSISERQRKVDQLSDVLVDIHSNRQHLLEYTYELHSVLNKLNKKYSVEKVNILKRLTDVNKMDANQFRFTDKDRDKIIEAELSDLKFKQSIITSQMDFLRESIKTLDNMVWNIRHIIELQQFKAGKI